MPSTVNVCVAPGRMLRPDAVQPTTCPACANPYPPGFVCEAALYVTAAGSVSDTVSAVSVSVPVFVTSIVYVTVPAGTGAAGTWLFVTVIVATGGFTEKVLVPNAVTAPKLPHGSVATAAA